MRKPHDGDDSIIKIIKRWQHYKNFLDSHEEGNNFVGKYSTTPSSLVLNTIKVVTLIPKTCRKKWWVTWHSFHCSWHELSVYHCKLCTELPVISPVHEVIFPLLLLAACAMIPSCLFISCHIRSCHVNALNTSEREMGMFKFGMLHDIMFDHLPLMTCKMCVLKYLVHPVCVCVCVLYIYFY